MKKIFTLVTAITLALGSSLNIAHAQNSYNVERLYGPNRYKTSINISTKFSNTSVKNVIIASGNNFPDALAGSVLSKKLEAPILLAGNSKGDNVDTIKYIKDHLSSNGSIYLLGGQASINEEFVSSLKSEGFKNIVRLGGKDRFETNSSIIKFMNVKKHTPVVIVNAYGFADALSISSIASLKGYPIIMTSGTDLPEKCRDILKDIEPSQIYVIGGVSSVDDTILAEIQTLIPSLKDSNIKRIQGINRYETSLSICKYFNFDTESAVLANGKNFPDALSGSALASKLNTSIILTDGKDITDEKEFLDSKNLKNVYLLGGLSSINLKSEFLLQPQSEIPQSEKDFINALYDCCNKYYKENTYLSANIINVYNEIFSEETMHSLRDKNKAIAIDKLDEIIKGYKDLNKFLLKHGKVIINLRGVAKNLKAPDRLLPLSREYVNNMDLYTEGLNSFIDLSHEYIKLFTNLKNATICNDPVKINSSLEKIKGLDVIAAKANKKFETCEHNINNLNKTLMELNNIAN